MILAERKMFSWISLLLFKIQDHLIREIKTWLNINHITVHSYTLQLQFVTVTLTTLSFIVSWPYIL